jgi:hypothetical protein
MYAYASLGRGTVTAEPNMSDTIPSQLRPGWEAALYRYPCGEVWLFMRPVGEELWSPERRATQADVEAFRRDRKLLVQDPDGAGGR